MAAPLKPMVALHSKSNALAAMLSCGARGQWQPLWTLAGSHSPRISRLLIRRLTARLWQVSNTLSPRKKPRDSGRVVSSLPGVLQTPSKRSQGLSSLVNCLPLASSNLNIPAFTPCISRRIQDGGCAITKYRSARGRPFTTITMWNRTCYIFVWLCHVLSAPQFKNCWLK